MQVQNATAPASAQSCIQTHDLSSAQLAALRYYLDRPLTEANRGTACDWLIAESSGQSNLPEYVTLADWQLVTTLRRPTDDNEDWLIYRRRQPSQTQPSHN
jgi:hypothetical protein